jgi:DNA (cytosine-5)-methyltransferase 1
MKQEKSKDKLTVIDFFCGAGGFSEGFRQKGFHILKGYDHWSPAIDTYNYNFGTKSSLTNILDFTDINEIELLPNTDVIIGSPPCVSFSSSNKSGKADKSLGLDLTNCFLRVVAVKKHQKNSVLKAWYMENVVNSKKYISKVYTFNDLNLNHWAKENGLNPKDEALNLEDNTTIINAADYGSYQARKRAISGEIIAAQKLIIPNPTHSKDEKLGLPNWNTLGKLLTRFPSPILKASNEVISDPVYPTIKLKQSEITDQFYDSGLYKSEWRQSKELKTNHYCMGKMSFPENTDKPSRTITATKSGTSRESLIYKSEYKREGNGEYRTPTIREASSIMGFPFTYQFLGSINSKWRLVGNAVCPSVSRALAHQVLLQLNFKPNKSLSIQQTVNLEDVLNLNDYKEKTFDKQPVRTKGSRFRRQPLKSGNITVTLSNYDIENNSKSLLKWRTSIQYGTGFNFKNQNVENNIYRNIEDIVSKQKGGPNFIKTLNNGFSDEVGSAKELQAMYEQQLSQENLIEPTLIVEKIGELIENIKFQQKYLIQKEKTIFKYKIKIPMEQVFALYGINKIASIANEKNRYEKGNSNSKN